VVYIIADDLTGATDTGAQFSKQGYNTQVVIVADSQHVANAGKVHQDTDVLVIDTETREVKPSTARLRIRHILQHLPVKKNDLIYKKIDSTLRGNIGVELDECLKILDKDICLFTPSLPANKRITVGGYLIVQDQPLGLSEYYTGTLEPADASYIPSLLASGTDFPSAHIDLKHVMRGEHRILHQMYALSSTGSKILVVDAINNTQLEHILKSSFQFDGSVLYAGSAGLANGISELYHGTKHVIPDNKHPGEPVLIVSGSMNMLTRRQIEHLITSIPLCRIIVDVEQLLYARDRCLKDALSQARQAFRERSHTLIYPNPLYLEKHRTQQMLSTHHLSFRELGVKIRNFLGTLTAAILEDAQTNNLIVTGGDTAIGVCSALGIYNLNIKDELLPGIPLSTGVFRENTALNIVTKAGGFGEEDSLCVLIEKLRQVGNCYDKQNKAADRN